jgi:hypothetical protein
MDWSLAWLWLQRFGGIVGAAVIAAAASYPFWLPHISKFIAGWMDRRFKKQMQDADHAFQEKVRHVQSAIDRELDRARKLQDREFEALSKAWEILHETFWRTREATNRAYQVVDLAAMQEDQLVEFVASLDFPVWRKKQLLEMIHGGDEDEAIQKYYVKGWRTKQYSECKKWRFKLVQYIDRKGIFMQPEIKDRFEKLQQLIADALLEFELRIRDIDVQFNPYDEHTHADALRAAEKGLYVELENLIRQRIWSPVQPVGN